MTRASDRRNPVGGIFALEDVQRARNQGQATRFSRGI